MSVPKKVGKRAGRAGYRWTKCVEYFKANHPWICGICGGDIPMGVDNQVDRMGYTLHHTPPLEQLLRQGLDPHDHQYLAPAHKSCNSSRGARTDAVEVNVSRQW